MKKSLIFAVLLSCASSISTAEVVSKSYWGDKAIGGHDTTAYYDVGVQSSHREVAGSKRYSVQWQGANWYFASQTSADKFAASPERYKPQYNGFCANALSLGEGLIPTDGTVWEFFGDQLHLFYAERGRERWLNGDWKRYQKEANTAWQQLKDS